MQGSGETGRQDCDIDIDCLGAVKSQKQGNFIHTDQAAQGRSDRAKVLSGARGRTLCVCVCIHAFMHKQRLEEDVRWVPLSFAGDTDSHRASFSTRLTGQCAPTILLPLSPSPPPAHSHSQLLAWI